MKRFTKLMSLFLFAAVTQYSCINDADVDSSSIQTGANGNVALLIEIPNTPFSRSAESSGDTEVGSDQENAVKSLTLYLFDSATKTFVNSYELKNISLVGNVSPRVQYTADNIEIEPGTYNIFAVANGKANNRNLDTQDNFLGAIDNVTYSAGKISSVPNAGFVMTNRGAANLNVKVEKPTDSDKVTYVSISLERTVAKIQLKQNENFFDLKDSDDKTYATITLTNFRMLNLATQFYTFRHTAVLNSFKEPAEYTDANFGKINDVNGYMIDPYFFKKTVEGAKGFDNKDGFFAQALVDMKPDGSDTDWAGFSGATNDWSTIYCLENGMFQTAQLNAYSTGIIFKANIDIAADRAFNEEGKKINPHDWSSMFYFDYNFYTSVSAIRKLVKNDLPDNINDNSSTEELAIYKIKKFTRKENYSCYYNYWIKHLDDKKDTEMGVMEFSIVRNSIYRISVTKVAGLGSGDPYIKPEQPNEFKAELNADIDVFPWDVRNQDAELD